MVSKEHIFKIVYPSPDGGAQIEIDGSPLTNVRSVKIECEVDKPTRVYLELVVVNLDANVEGEVILDVTNLNSKAREKKMVN